MKVAIFNVEGGHAGGAASIACDIALAVNNTGGASVINYGRLGIEEHGVEIRRIDNNVDIYYHVMISRLLDIHGNGSYIATRRAIEELDRFKPDLINLHIIHGYYLNYECLFEYIKNNKLPVVWTFHDCWAFTGHCATFDDAGCEKWKYQCGDCPKKGFYPKSLLIDNSKNNYIRKKNVFTSVDNLTIVTPSEWLASKVRESFLNKYPVKVINNGIDLDVFTHLPGRFKEKHNLIGKKMVLGVAATWSESKGYYDFLKLSSILPDDYVIVLVGLSDEQLNSIPRNILGIRRTTDRNELIEAYSAADVFVDPTRSDNFPTVILEALACGTPVVTYDTGGCPEEIDNTCGRVVAQGDIPGLCQSVIDLINMGDISNQCINRAQLFDKKDKCLEYMHLFNSMLSGN